jgi:hypothetical protein
MLSHKEQSQSSPSLASFESASLLSHRPPLLPFGPRLLFCSRHLRFGSLRLLDRESGVILRSRIFALVRADARTAAAAAAATVNSTPLQGKCQVGLIPRTLPVVPYWSMLLLIRTFFWNDVLHGIIRICRLEQQHIGPKVRAPQDRRQ